MGGQLGRGTCGQVARAAWVASQGKVVSGYGGADLAPDGGGVDLTPASLSSTDDPLLFLSRIRQPWMGCTWIRCLRPVSSARTQWIWCWCFDLASPTCVFDEDAADLAADVGS